MASKGEVGQAPAGPRRRSCSWVRRPGAPRSLVPRLDHSPEGWLGRSPPWEGTRAHPGMPPASILLATVTSVDHTSYCQRFWPRTPPSTVPVCTPTRMSTPVFVFSRTYLPGTHTNKGGLSLCPARRPTPLQPLPAAPLLSAHV